MRFIGLALILLSLPLFIALLQADTRRRTFAMMALGALFFFTGRIQTDAAIITWPLWTGVVRGIEVSLVDSLALALIVTRQRGANGLPFLWLFGAQFLLLTLSVMTSYMPVASFFSWFQFLRVTIVFIAIGGELSRPGAYPALMKGLSIGLTIQAGYVIYQKMSGVVQATGTMAHQNLLGVMTELALINLVAALLEGHRHNLIKMGILSGGIVIMGGGSRGAMAIAGVAIIALALLSLIRNRPPHKLKFIGLGVLMLLVLAPFGMMTLKDRFGNTSMLAEEEQRFAMERAAKSMAADHPMGVGANLYTNISIMSGYADKAGVAWNKANRSVPVHNVFLLSRAETGRAGELLLMLMLAVPGVTGLIFAFKDRRSRSGGYVLGASVTIFATAFHATYEYSISVYVALVLLIMNFAIIAGYMRNARLATKQKRRPAKRADGTRHIMVQPAAFAASHQPRGS